tara:strand:- start:1334 stop:1672 length:339 start_codon:yes stop_codon:yes gene_type:complete
MKKIRIPKTPNAKARKHVQRRTAFEGTNLFGVRRKADSGDRYVVYAFGTHWPIFVCDGGVWYQNDTVKPYDSVVVNKMVEQIHPIKETTKLDVETLRLVATRGATALGGDAP